MTDGKIGNEHPDPVFENEKDEEQHIETKEQVHGAVRATEGEHAMTLREALRQYPKAVYWSCWFSMALVMQGFDHAFIYGFIGFPPFEKKYGVPTSDGGFEVPANDQAAITNCVAAGEIVGLLINGWLADWLGYRKVMAGSLVLFMAFVFLQFFAVDIAMYIGAELALGVPWGVFQTITTTYAAEISPGALRPYLTMFIPGCWCVGYLIGTAIIRGFLQMEGQWAYRIPFALQWIPPIPILIAVYFAPESPWWLLSKDRIEEATAMLKRLRAKDSSEEGLMDTLDMMQHTIRVEAEMKQKATYRALFNKQNLRRTEIVFWVYTSQQMCAQLMSYIVYFLQEAGLSTSISFEMAMGQYALGTVAVAVSFLLVPRWGRRTFLLVGLGYSALTTFVIGFLGLGGTREHPALANAIGALLIIQYGVFFGTITPITYTIVSEIPTSVLRTKSVALGRSGYNLITIIYGQLIPRMIQESSWDWGARCGLLWGGIMAIMFVWAFFRVPETKHRTFEEVDLLFANGVGARKFKKAHVDIATGSVNA
ncbi:sugar transporter family protein [Hortaea werneckii]|nr:sugar transporter family protein [Hortaea werneckii]